MKKIISLLLVLAFSVSFFTFAGCGNESAAETESEACSITSAADFYTEVWGQFAEADRFPAAGGDQSNMSDGPAKYAINEDTKEMFLYLLHVTDELYAMLEDDAATLQHMMNTNTFSSAVAKLKDASKAAEFAEAYKQTVQSQQWMCGFPDKVAVISVGGYIVFAFGAESIIGSLITACQAVEPSSRLLVDAPAVVD